MTRQATLVDHDSRLFESCLHYVAYHQRPPAPSHNERTWHLEVLKARLQRRISHDVPSMLNEVLLQPRLEPRLQRVARILVRWEAAAAATHAFRLCSPAGTKCSSCLSRSPSSTAGTMLAIMF